MAKAKPPAALTTDPTTTPTAEKKRSRAKSEYFIERKVLTTTAEGGSVSWETFMAVHKDTASALKYLADPKNAIVSGEYRIVVIKWQKTVKQVQQTTVQFE